LFIAIGFRISDYGLTVSRYAILVIGIWIGFIAIYFSLGKKNIKIIPISLCVLLSIGSFGPWGVFSLSEKNQAARLKRILEQTEMLENGQVKNSTKLSVDSIEGINAHSEERQNENLINDSLRMEIRSILNYLDDFHGFESIQGLFNQNIDSIIAIHSLKNKYIHEPEIYMKAMGIGYNSNNSSSISSTYYNFRRDKDQLNSVPKGEYFIDFQFSNYSYESNNYRINNKSFSISSVKDSSQLKITIDDSSYYINLKNIARKIIANNERMNEYNIHSSQMTSKHHFTECTLTLFYEQISGYRKRNEVSVTSAKGIIFLQMNE
jgi:hypothetical protein